MKDIVFDQEYQDFDHIAKVKARIAKCKKPTTKEHDKKLAGVKIAPVKYDKTKSH